MKNILGTAIMIASVGFENTFDKSGEPYILHCLRVMNNLHTRNKELQAIAVLHDCIEDNVCTFEDIIYKYQFPKRVIDALTLLTHEKNRVSYEDYIKAIASNEDARLVKLADLKDNSNITRLKGLTKADFDRMEKYHKAFVYLSKI